MMRSDTTIIVTNIKVDPTINPMVVTLGSVPTCKIKFCSLAQYIIPNEVVAGIMIAPKKF